MKKVHQILEKITFLFATISIIGVLFMMLFISVDVVIRWVSHGSIKGVYELVEIAMAASVFSAFSYTQIKHSHVHVTLLIQYFPQKLKMFSYAFTSLITTVVMFAIAYAALTQSQASAAQNQMTSVLSIPLYPFYIFEAIAMCFFGLVLLYDTLRCFVAVFNKGLADEIQSTWS